MASEKTKQLFADAFEKLAEQRVSTRCSSPTWWLSCGIPRTFYCFFREDSCNRADIDLIWQRNS